MNYDYFKDNLSRFGKYAIPYAPKGSLGDTIATNTGNGFWSQNGGAIIGAGASLLGTVAQIGLGINSLRQNKQSLEQAQKALDFQKEQYNDQKKNYDGYMQQTNQSADSYSLKREGVSAQNQTMPMDKI